MSAAAAPRSMLPQRQSRPPDHRLPHHPDQVPPPAPPRPPEASPRRRLPSLETSAYAGILRCASRARSLALARLAHSHMVRAGYLPGLLLRNNLLAAYARCGDMRHARLLLDGMPRRDAVSWNTLIAGYSSQGSTRLALGAFRDARRDSGVAVDRFTYATVLAACGGAGDGRSGRAAHGLALVSGLARTAFVTNSVIDMYAKCGMIDEVRLVFDRAEERDEVSWNLLLSAYVRMGWPEVAVNVLVWMHRSGVKLDAFALGGILKACSELDDSEDVRMMLHGCVVKVGLDLDVFVGSAMVDMYAKNGGLEEAIKVFDCIPDQNVVIYNAMIAGFARLGNEPCPETRIEAVRLYVNLLQRRIRPSKFTFKSLLEVCSLTNAVRCARQVHAHVILSGFEDASSLEMR